MVIGLVHLEFRIPENQSLKGKRHVIKGLKDRIRQRFNVSVAEVAHQDKWQLATLAASCVGTDQVGVNRVLNQLVDFAGEDRNAELTDVQMEML